jgi:hypothetical protein
MYNTQPSVDRINNQIAELEKMREQVVQPVQPTPNVTQNFQISPTTTGIKYADNINEVQRDFVLGDTPYFSRDMSVLWVKNVKGEIKSYELKEIVQKDEKDLQIEFLQAQIEDLKRERVINNEQPINSNVNESIENKKPTNVQSNRRNGKK